MEVRGAKRGDWPAIVPLLVQLGAVEFEKPGRAASFRRRYAAYLRRRDTVVLVAEVDGRVAGFMNMEIRRRFTQVDPYAWPANLVVDEAQRRRGIGQALFERAEAEARRRGCAWMLFESAKERLDSHRFFETIGYEEKGKSFGKRL